MARVRRVFLPRWIPWFMMLFLLPTWIWITYRVFFTPEGRADLGVAGWLIMTAIILVGGVVVFLMGYGKLPAYVIRDEEGDST